MEELALWVDSIQQEIGGRSDSECERIGVVEVAIRRLEEQLECELSAQSERMQSSVQHVEQDLDMLKQRADQDKQVLGWIDCVAARCHRMVIACCR